MVHGMFILGNDPDTKELFNTTARFCKETNVVSDVYQIRGKGHPQTVGTGKYALFIVFKQIAGTSIIKNFDKHNIVIYF